MEDVEQAKVVRLFVCFFSSLFFSFYFLEIRYEI